VGCKIELDNYFKKFQFADIYFHSTNLKDVCKNIINYNFNSPKHIALPDSSVVAASINDPQLRRILNKTWLTLPDGKPIEIIGRRKGFKGTRTISGYWICEKLLNSTLTHYFYGSESDKQINLIINKIKKIHPKSIILGHKAPPIIDLNEIDNNRQIKTDIMNINLLSPNIVWVGISSPKQDYLISTYLNSFGNSIIIGMGGVFNYYLSENKRSPEIIKKIGFRWLWRLIVEPRRLWKKYFNVFYYLSKPFIKEFIIKD